MCSKLMLSSCLCELCLERCPHTCAYCVHLSWAQPGLHRMSQAVGIHFLQFWSLEAKAESQACSDRTEGFSSSLADSRPLTGSLLTLELSFVHRRGDGDERREHSMSCPLIRTPNLSEQSPIRTMSL